MASQAGVLAAGILSENTGAAMATAAVAAKLAVDLPNSRTAETEADRIGIELAAKAGYDPRAAVTLWKKMAATGSGEAPPAFMSTHPSDQQRQQRLAELAPKMQPYYQAAGARPTHPVRIGGA
jgi:predicted Zn-dependent protease